MLGGGVFFWALGIYFAIREDRLLDARPSEDVVILSALTLAAAAALALGYRAPLRSYLGLVGRTLGAMGFGLLVLFVFVLATERFHWGSEERPTVFAAGGLGLGLAALAWIHGRRLAPQWRQEPRLAWPAGVAGVVVLLTAWTLSPGLRCALGSGRSCLLAAARAVEAGDDARGLSLVERGCALDSAASCQVAGDAYWGAPRDEAPVPPDRRRAESLYRTACALGDERGCASLHVAELHDGCEGQHAAACRELSGAYRSGSAVSRDTAVAARYLRQACLLGDAEACGGR
jgi:hypothetical protein